MQRIRSNFEEAVLYVVATPIGNLAELSPRAVDVLKSVDFICSEDTRTTALLLKPFGIEKPFVSCHQHNEQQASEKIVAMLKTNKKAALTSDAGYPGISDPGAILIRHCIENDIAVSIINGANAFIPALIGSGLCTDHFYFHGFLPAKESERIREIEKVKDKTETMIFYEAPHRIASTMQNLFHVLGDRKACIAREITKLYEEYLRGSLSEFIDFDFSSVKGEMVVVVEGNSVQPTLSDEEILSLIKQEIEAGTRFSDAVKKISETYALKKNRVYQLAVQWNKKNI